MSTEEEPKSTESEENILEPEEGKGKFVFPGGGYYGEMKFVSRASYIGDFKGNKFQGNGVYTWADGSKYEGEWKDNKLHGHGCYVDTEKTRWEGTFFNGRYDNGRAKVLLR